MLRVLVILAALSVLSGVMADTNGPGEVAMHDLGPKYAATGHPGHEGHKRVNHDILLSNDLVTYGIRYCACTDKSHAPYVVPLEGYIGMPRPCACNWYHSGFMEIIVDGDNIGRYPLADFAALGSGPRGLARMVWDYAGGRVRVSFLLEPGSRYLKVQILLSPSKPPKSIVLALRCYPSYFTSYYHRQGARRIVTPSAEVKQGERKTLPASDNWWALYKDDVFDPARGEGEGPCGLMLMPAQAKSITFAPGDYAVETRIEYKPDQRDLRLAFWDFKGMANAKALELMKKTTSQVLAQLLTTNFTPLLVQRTSLAAERAEFERLRALAGPKLAAEEEKRLAAAEKALQAARKG
ncbi:MAG: hypothetical protein J7M26_02080, partial [Armatimonadetes bacterium]|nr:hypothetical protein [Armatimonadota bacterium]